MEISNKYKTLPESLIKTIFKNVNSIEIVNLNKKDTSLKSFLIILDTIINGDKFRFKTISNSNIKKDFFKFRDIYFWKKVFSELNNEIEYVIKYKLK